MKNQTSHELDQAENTTESKDDLRPGGTLWRAVVQGVAAGILLGGMFAGGYFFNKLTTPPYPENPQPTSFALLDEADALIAAHYLYDLPEEGDRVHGALQGLVASLGDPYASFAEPQTAEVNNTNLAGRFGGIGAEITQDENGRFVVARVYRDNPAEQAGLLAGDVITAIDGEAIDPAEQNMNDVLAGIRGEIGDPVRLTVERGGEELTIEIIRAEILVPSVFWHILEQDQRIGYIQITRFTDRTAEELQRALNELHDQEAQAYVLDLRNNSGGLVTASVDVAGEFVNGGVVLYELRQTGSETIMNASRGGLAVDLPLAVLINPHTASAAEIVAGALQDRERAVLIGQNTYGKGSVQVILELSDGSSIRVTSAEWFTPDHNRIEGEGLAPDILIEHADGEDQELAAALEYLGETLLVAQNNQ